MESMRAEPPVVAGATGRDDIESLVLPAVRAAITTHIGPYEGLREAHAAVETFIDEQGLSPAGPLRELYLTDPGEVPNPEEWQTQVVWPVAG